MITQARALIRVGVTVPRPQAEEARARMIELFPEGFEEVDRADAVGDRADTVELAAYTDDAGAERARAAFETVAVGDVAPGWQDGWRAFHRPALVAGIWIGPPWETPPADRPAVVIDPGRAFGTGAHPTTRLTLELLLGLEGPRGSLLDVGCGSGVLAIAGARAGFSPVIAVDVDPVAVEVTRDNAAANGVEVDARVVDGREGALPAVDAAVANIELRAVGVIAARLDARAIVTSGYLACDRPTVPGRTHADRAEAGGWAADLWLGGPGPHRG